MKIAYSRELKKKYTYCHLLHCLEIQTINLVLPNYW